MSGRLNLFLLIWVLLGAQSAVAEEGWKRDLRAEIRAQQDCEVAFLSHIVERSIEGRQMVMVKVHCMDQRSFDAVRQDKAAVFQFKECTRANTSSC